MWNEVDGMDSCRALSVNISLPVLIIDLIPKAGSVDHCQLHSHSFLLNIWAEKKPGQRWSCRRKQREERAAANRG